MNPYAMLGSAVETTDAVSLRNRLAAWHDAMVAHERRLRSGSTSDVCDDECPHAEARLLWSEALATFGPRVKELAFLRSRAMGASRRPTVSARAEAGSATADHNIGAQSAKADSSPAIASARTHAAEL
jgi:hypothetical protein